MSQHDPRVDAYIAKAAEFARPILQRLRATVHAACPEAEEAIKWGMPNFLYRGKILCNMAAFKQHVAFGFWQGAALDLGDAASDEAMGQLGRISKLSDLPGKRALSGWIQQAMALRDAGAKRPATKTGKPKPPVTVPADLAAALKKNKRAQATFNAFPPSARRDYVEWIVEARREETRRRRLDQAVEWLAEGKRRHWKYEAD